MSTSGPFCEKNDIAEGLLIWRRHPSLLEARTLNNLSNSCEGLQVEMTFVLGAEENEDGVNLGPGFGEPNSPA